MPVRWPNYVLMHKIPVLLLNVNSQDYLRMLLRKAKLVAELQWYTVAISFTRVYKMCQVTTAKNSNFKMMWIVCNCPSRMLLHSVKSLVLYLSGEFATTLLNSLQLLQLFL